jgi:hypothetical protein
MLGTIKNRVYKKYEKESAKLKMVQGGAWTINLDELNIFSIDLIIYETKKNIYSISRSDALNYGSRLLLGGEMKLIVPLSHWAKLKKEN